MADPHEAKLITTERGARYVLDCDAAALWSENIFVWLKNRQQRLRRPGR